MSDNDRAREALAAELVSALKRWADEAKDGESLSIPKDILLVVLDQAEKAPKLRGGQNMSLQKKVGDAKIYSMARLRKAELESGMLAKQAEYIAATEAQERFLSIGRTVSISTIIRKLQ